MLDERFVGAARRLMDALGQTLVAARPTREALLVETREGLLFVFLPSSKPLADGQGEEWITGGRREGSSVVLLSPEPISPDLRARYARLGASLVDGERFQVLIHQLNLDRSWAPWLPEPPSGGESSLPTAREVGGWVERADRWLEWGVPRLALEFYDRAVTEKPGYRRALNGRGWALLALGRIDEARQAFASSLDYESEDIDARIGFAAARGAAGDPEGELEDLRKLWEDHPSREDLLAHYVAALVALGRWSQALAAIDREGVHRVCGAALRFLRGEILERLGRHEEAVRDRTAALSAGLTDEAARAIRGRLPPTPSGGYSEPSPEPNGRPRDATP